MLRADYTSSIAPGRIGQGKKKGALVPRTKTDTQTSKKSERALINSTLLSPSPSLFFFFFSFLFLFLVWFLDGLAGWLVG